MRPPRARSARSPRVSARSSPSAASASTRVAPGPIWTPLVTMSFPADKNAQFGADTPLGRPGQPGELAALYVFLATEDSRYISGEVIGATAGRCARVPVNPFLHSSAQGAPEPGSVPARRFHVNCRRWVTQSLPRRRLAPSRRTHRPSSRIAAVRASPTRAAGHDSLAWSVLGAGLFVTSGLAGAL